LNQTAAAKYGATIIAVLVKKNYPLQVALFTLKYIQLVQKKKKFTQLFSAINFIMPSVLPTTRLR